MNNMQQRQNSFSLLPEVVKNLLIINGLFFLGKISLKGFGIDLDGLLGLHYFKSENFQFYQIITYMFMHGDFSHILFNMFGLWMFGTSIENLWGGKKFLNYYLITGVGAAMIHYLIIYFDVSSIESTGRLVNYESIAPVIGASGSVFGVLLAFGMMFPNRLIYIYFLFPVKAKYIIIGLAAYELYRGVFVNDNVANFAHLGGMLFGFILIKLWNKKANRNEFL